VQIQDHVTRHVIGVVENGKNQRIPRHGYSKRNNPKADYDVPSDLLIFMRNDPMFYRKNFFPAIERYKEDTKDTAPLENMVKRGLGEYCNKFKIENPKEELMGEGDIIDLVRTIIADEMEDQDENK